MKKEPFLTKSKVIVSALAAVALAFSFFIVGPLGFFFSQSNRGFFEDNNIYDHMIVPLMSVAALVCALVIFGVLILLRGKLYNIAISGIAWLLVCGYIQTLFFNGWTRGLIGDGTYGIVMPYRGIPNFILWFVLGVIIVIPAFFGGKLKKVAEISKMFVTYLLVLVFAMQGAGLLETIINAPDEKENAGFLSTENLFEVSEEDNIIVFVIDRFDRDNYLELLDFDSDFFKDFDGFTSYSDNISLYTRTYPAIASMLTGMENDFEGTREEYFEKAYSDSAFLKDMSDGGYDVNIYTANWYSYSDANDIYGVSNAVDAGDSVKLDDPMGLLGAMVRYSAYNFGPDKLKPYMGISTNSFVGFASQTTGYEMYKIDDVKLCETFREKGLTGSGTNKSFTFLHMRGCHSPFNMDENCNRVSDNSVTALQQTRGIFKFISEYIDALKAEGVYENSTIIITGDHPQGVSDVKELPYERLTPLIIKEKGQAGTAFKESEAPVCQANLIPTIIKCAGVKASEDYGKAYSEVSEDEVITRKYLFEKTVDSKDLDEIVEYEITGSASDFSNWKVKERHVIGSIYK